MRDPAYRLVAWLGAVVVLGGACARPPAAAPPTQFRLVTWNIHGCAGGLDEVTAELERLRADIICLQEAECGIAADTGVNQAGQIARRLGMTHVAAGSPLNQERRQQMAILSRWPVDAAEPLDAGTGRIYGVAARVRAPGGPIHVVCVHLTSSYQLEWALVARTSAARDTESRHLAAYAAGRTGPIVVAGDFNTLPGTPALDRVAEVLPTWAPPRPTFPSSQPAVAIDHVLGSSDLAVRASAVPQSVASDHRPVSVDFEWSRR